MRGEEPADRDEPETSARDRVGITLPGVEEHAAVVDEVRDVSAARSEVVRVPLLRVTASAADHDSPFRFFHASRNEFPCNWRSPSRIRATGVIPYSPAIDMTVCIAWR